MGSFHAWSLNRYIGVRHTSHRPLCGKMHLYLQTKTVSRQELSHRLFEKPPIAIPQTRLMKSWLNKLVHYTHYRCLKFVLQIYSYWNTTEMVAIKTLVPAFCPRSPNSQSYIFRIQSHKISINAIFTC